MNKHFFLLIFCLLVSVLTTKAEWPDSFDQGLVAMHGIMDVNGVPAAEGGIIIVADEGEWGRGLRAQRISRNGELLWNPDDNGISVYDSGNGRFGCFRYMLLTDNQNGVYVFYVRDDYAVEDRHFPRKTMYLQHIDANGETTWGDNGLVIDSTHQEWVLPIDILWFDEDRIALFWANANDRLTETSGQLITSDGDKLWGDNGRRVHSTRTHACFADSTLGFFLIGQGGAPITSQYIDQDGDPVWNDDGIELDFFVFRSNQIANGEIAYCGTRGRERDLFFNIINREGELRFDPDIQITDTAEYRRGTYGVYRLDNGRIYIQWGDRTSGHSEVYYQIIDGEGQKLIGDEGQRLFPDSYSSGFSGFISSKHPAALELDGFLFSVCFVTATVDSNISKPKRMQKINGDGERLFGDYGFELSHMFEGHGEPHGSWSDGMWPMLDGCGGIIYPAVDWTELNLWRIRSDGSLGGPLAVKNDKTALKSSIGYSIFPNPTNSGIEILFYGQRSIVEWFLFDLSGRTILSSNSYSNKMPGTSIRLNLTQLPAGEYIFRMQSDESSQSSAVILIK